MSQSDISIFFQDTAREVIIYIYDHYEDKIEDDPPSELIDAVQEHFPQFTRIEITDILQGCYIHA